MSVSEQVKALDNGRGIQYLLDSTYAIFNNPVYMIDSFYNLIAASDGPMEMGVWNELITTGTFSVELKIKMAQAGIYDIVANLEKPVIIKKSGDFRSYNLMTGQIVNREKDLVGELVIYEYYSDFDTESLEAFEMLLDKVSSEIHDYDYFARLPDRFFEFTVHKLLDRTARNTTAHHSQARIMRYHFEKYLYVAVVNAVSHDFPDNIHRSRLEYFRSLLKTIYKSSRTAIYADKIVMLLSSKYGNLYEALPLGQDHSVFECNGLHAGISNSFENIYEFGQNYDQAVTALDNGMNNNSNGLVYSLMKP